MDPSGLNWSAAAIVLATFGGPIAAIQVQKYLERRQQRRALKEATFRALMATRAMMNRTSPEHVQALNGIELTFSERGKDKAVVEAWNAYRDLLNTPNPASADAAQRLYEKRGDLFWDLLHAMSRALGYPFDRTYLKNSLYSPIAHGDVFRDHEAIRTGLAALLAGERVIRVMNVSERESNIPSGKMPSPQGLMGAKRILPPLDTR